MTPLARVREIEKENEKKRTTTRSLAMEGKKMTVRRVAAALLLCLASPFAHAAFTAPLQWVHLGTNAQNQCLLDPATGTCKLFDTALEAGVANTGSGTFCNGTAIYWSGTSPNEIWRVSTFRVNGNCTGTSWDNFVKQNVQVCPDHSSLSGGYPSNVFDKRKYPARVQELYRYAAALQELLNKACPGNKKAQELFDNWLGRISPRWADPVTDYVTKTTDFTEPFFDKKTYGFGKPGPSFVFMHEFMHLIESNYELSRSTSAAEYINAFTRGTSNDLPFEKQADQLVRDLLNGKCPCD